MLPGAWKQPEDGGLPLSHDQRTPEPLELRHSMAKLSVLTLLPAEHISAPQSEFTLWKPAYLFYVLVFFVFKDNFLQRFVFPGVGVGISRCDNTGVLFSYQTSQQCTSGNVTGSRGAHIKQAPKLP